MRGINQLLMISVLATLNGCASVGYRLEAYQDRKYRPPIVYPATAIDLGVVSYVLSRPIKPFTDPSFSPDAQEGVVFAILPFSVVDLPLAVLIDTVCLPYDVHRRLKYEPESPVDRRQLLRETASE